MSLDIIYFEHEHTSPGPHDKSVFVLSSYFFSILVACIYNLSFVLSYFWINLVIEHQKIFPSKAGLHKAFLVDLYTCMSSVSVTGQISLLSL